MEKLSEQDIENGLNTLNGWDYTDKVIRKNFKFDNFKSAFSIMTRIAFECEAQGHHPDWSNVYNTLNISLSTHEADGITEKDFKLARSIEEIIQENP